MSTTKETKVEKVEKVSSSDKHVKKEKVKKEKSSKALKEERHQPIVSGSHVASSHTGPHSRPIFETTTKTGAHVVVSQDISASKRNPIAELATTAARGEPVHNQQIGNIIDRTTESLERQRKGNRLDAQGQLLAKDTEEILQATERILYEKNKEEDLQNLIRHGRAVPHGTGRLNLPEETRDHARNVYNNVRTLAIELLRSGEFREMSNEILDLFKDILSERRGRMHTPTFVSETYVPYTSVIPQERVVKSVYEVKNIGPQSTSEPFVEHTIVKEAVPTTSMHSTHLPATTLPSETIPTSARSFPVTQEFGSTPYKPTYTAEYLPSIVGASTLPSKVIEREHVVPSTVTEGTYGTGYTAPSTFSERGFGTSYTIPQESSFTRFPGHTGYINPANYTSEEIEIREKIVDRFLNLLQRIGSKEEFHRSMTSLFAIYNAFSQQLKTVKADPNKAPVDTASANDALVDARKLLENFTGKQEMGLLRKHLTVLIEDARSDEELTTFFRRFQEFCSNAVAHPQTLNTTEKRLEARELVYHGTDLLHREEWGYQFRQIIDDLRLLLDNIRKDSTTSNFTSKLEQFARDFAFNEEGRPDLWVIDDSLHQLRLMLVPMLRSHLENIPIDRIEMTSHKFDAVIEDLLFSGADILPDHLELKIKNKMKVNLQEAEHDKTTHKLKLTVDHIKPTLHNLKFYYKKKTGFPKMEDYGVVDVALRGEGMGIQIVWKLVSKKGQPARVQLVSTKCIIDTLVIHFVKEKTKHDFIDRIFVKLLNNTIRRRIANAVAEYLQVKVTQVDDQINQFFANRPVDRLKSRADSALKHSMEKRETSHLTGSKGSAIPVSSTTTSFSEDIPISSRLPHTTSPVNPHLSTSSIEEPRLPGESVKKTTITETKPVDSTKAAVLESKAPALTEQVKKTTI